MIRMIIKLVLMRIVALQIVNSIGKSMIEIAVYQAQKTVGNQWLSFTGLTQALAFPFGVIGTIISWASRPDDPKRLGITHP